MFASFFFFFAVCCNKTLLSRRKQTAILRLSFPSVLRHSAKSLRPLFKSLLAVAASRTRRLDGCTNTERKNSEDARLFVPCLDVREADDLFAVCSRQTNCAGLPGGREEDGGGGEEKKKRRLNSFYSC